MTPSEDRLPLSPADESGAMGTPASEEPREPANSLFWIGLVVATLMAGMAGFWAPRIAVRLWQGGHPPGTARHRFTPTAPNARARTEASGAPSAAVAGAPVPPASAESLARLPDPASPLPTSQVAMADELRKVAGHLVECFPSDPDAMEVTARCEKLLGSTAEAVACWDRCLDLNPSYAYAHYGKATVAAKKGEHEEAADLFRRALDANPDWPEAELELARALINVGRPQESIPVLEKHVQRRPFLSEAYVLLGQSYLQGGEYQKAKTSFETAVRILPEYANAYYGLATACARLGQQERAREAMEQFRKRKDADYQVRKKDKIEYDDLDAMRIDASPIYLHAGQIYYTRKRPAEAERLWRRAATLNPRYVECHQALAWLYRSTGRLPQAVEMLEQLAEIEPTNSVYLEEITRLYAELGQPAKAEEARRRLEQRLEKEQNEHEKNEDSVGNP